LSNFLLPSVPIHTSWFFIIPKLFGVSSILGKDHSNTSTVYVRFWPSATPRQHNWQMWAQDSQDGTWGAVNGTQFIYGATDGLIWGWETEWTTSPPIGIAATISGVMKIQNDGATTKKAKFTSTGCDIMGGQTPSGDFYGGCKVIGSSITPDKLPFTP